MKITFTIPILAYKPCFVNTFLEFLEKYFQKSLKSHNLTSLISIFPHFNFENFFHFFQKLRMKNENCAVFTYSQFVHKIMKIIFIRFLLFGGFLRIFHILPCPKKEKKTAFLRMRTKKAIIVIR